MNEITLNFERALYQAVIRYKEAHPGELEERTRQRKEKERREERANN